MKIIIIIQARMGSTRLPSKILKPILGKPMLELELERLKRAAMVDVFVLATTEKPEDDATAALGERLGITVFRGSENDVLDRYYGAAKEARADVVVRVTGDCPMHHGAVIDKVLQHFLHTGVDYCLGPADYPEGFDTEVFTFAALERAWRDARLPSEREHVTPYVRNHPELFRVAPAWRLSKNDYSKFHFSVDTPQDFTLVEAVFAELGEDFMLPELLELVKRRPELLEINKGGTGFEGYEKSLEEDKKFLKKKL